MKYVGRAQIRVTKVHVEEHLHAGKLLVVLSSCLIWGLSAKLSLLPD